MDKIKDPVNLVSATWFAAHHAPNWLFCRGRLVVGLLRPMRTASVRLRRLGPRPHQERFLFLRRDDFAAIIMTACGTEMMGPFQLAAIRAFRMGFRPECMMRAAHIALRRRGLSFWNRHGENPSKLKAEANFAPAKEGPR